MTHSTRLDDDSIAMLLDEVCAMAASGRALITGLADLDDQSMGKLGRAAAEVRDQIAAGKSAGESIAVLSDRYKAPIRTAMQVLAETGSTEPIYETTRLIRESKRQREEAFTSAINPILNVVVAATVLFFVMPWILVSLSEAELIKTPASPSVAEILKTFTTNFTIASAAVVVTIAAVGIVFYRVLARPLRSAQVIRDHGVFCRWLAMQLLPAPDSKSGRSLETGRVIHTAAEVVGGSFADSWAVVVERVRGGAITGDSLAVPPTTPEPVHQCVVDLVSGHRESDAIASDLQKLSDLYSQKSSLHRSWWIGVFPRGVSCLLVIAIIVLLLRAILVPMIQTIVEVVT